MQKQLLRRRALVSALVAGGVIAGAASATGLRASDHQDTPEVELSPRFDARTLSGGGPTAVAVSR